MPIHKVGRTPKALPAPPASRAPSDSNTPFTAENTANVSVDTTLGVRESDP